MFSSVFYQILIHQRKPSSGVAESGDDPFFSRRNRRAAVRLQPLKSRSRVRTRGGANGKQAMGRAACA